MSADKFDRELSALYQQRKQQVVVPEINLDSPASIAKPVRSPLNMLTLLVAGGMASFGILAIISHFAKPPVHGENNILKQHSVRIVQLPKTVTAPEVIALSEKLPVKPEAKIALPPTMVVKERLQILVPVAKLSMNGQTATNVSVPKITALKLTLNPVRRVTPRYPKKAIVERQSGQVKLSYKIAADGSPMAIELLKSPGHRLLEKSAKQALTQWRYPVNKQSEQRLEVMFEFNLAKTN